MKGAREHFADVDNVVVPPWVLIEKRREREELRRRVAATILGQATVAG